MRPLRRDRSQLVDIHVDFRAATEFVESGEQAEQYLVTLCSQSWIA